MSDKASTPGRFEGREARVPRQLLGAVRNDDGPSRSDEHSLFTEGGWSGPIKIVTIDVDAPLPDLSAQRDNGGRYAGVWCLLRRGSHPLGLVRFDFEADVITADELSRRISRCGFERSSADDPPAARTLPLASVVIPSIFSRKQDLRSCLDAVSGLDYPNFEVLLVDNRPDSVDAVPEWLSQYHLVRLIKEPRPGISQARNAGIREARGEFIAFTDDDVVVDSGWLRAYGEYFVNHPTAACVTGPFLAKELETPAQLRCEAYLNGMWPELYQPVTHRLVGNRSRVLFNPMVGEYDERGGLLRTFPLYASMHFGGGANMAYRTEALRSIGGFDVHLGIGTPTLGGEDHKPFIQLAAKGYDVGFTPDALIFHKHREDDESLRHQVHGFGKGYSAMLTSVLLEDPRHVIGVMSALPTLLRSFVSIIFRRVGRARTLSEHAGPTKEGEMRRLRRLELLGYLIGPVAYLRSYWHRRSA